MAEGVEHQHPFLEDPRIQISRVRNNDLKLLNLWLPKQELSIIRIGQGLVGSVSE